MIGRLLQWFQEVLGEFRAMYQDLREYADFERAKVRAAACGIGPEEIDAATTHPTLRGSGSLFRGVVVVRSLMRLAIVGLRADARRAALVGMVIRYQEWAGPGIFQNGTMPDHLLHNCSQALADTVTRGHVSREGYRVFVEAYPQFRSVHGLEPRGDHVLQWFLGAGMKEVPVSVFSFPTT